MSTQSPSNAGGSYYGCGHQPGNCPPGNTSQPGDNCPPGNTSQPGGNRPPEFQPSTTYIERIGHFPKREIDAAIARDRTGFEVALKTLVNGIDLVKGHGGAWKPLGHRLIEFQNAWRITEPQLREGPKATQGRNWDSWQKMRRDEALGTQKRFYAAHNEFMAYSNGSHFDNGIGFASMQRVLWSVWRVMEYMGIAESV